MSGLDTSMLSVRYILLIRLLALYIGLGVFLLMLMLFIISLIILEESSKSESWGSFHGGHWRKEGVSFWRFLDGNRFSLLEASLSSGVI